MNKIKSLEDLKRVREEALSKRPDQGGQRTERNCSWHGNRWYCSRST